MIIRTWLRLTFGGDELAEVVGTLDAGRDAAAAAAVAKRPLVESRAEVIRMRLHLFTHGSRECFRSS